MLVTDPRRTAGIQPARLGLAFLLLLTAPPLFAQNAGSLRGTLTDSSGAVVPGATVVLINDATRFTRQVVSDARGGYFFSAVDPGTHRVIELALKLSF